MGTRLADLFDGWLIDLDGVVYIGERVLAGAPEAVLALREVGARVLFMTNDSRNSRDEYAERLTQLGIPTEAKDLVTSGSATACFLAREGLTNRSVFVMGSAALKAEIERVGCRVVEGRDGLNAEVVVISGHEGFDYDELSIGSIAARRGARLIATARDPSFPTADGPAPAAGSIVAAVETASGIGATVVGKPERLMFEIARARMPERRRVVVVGDRLDSDVLGGHRAGLPAILVRDPGQPAADPRGRGIEPDYEIRALSAILEGRRGGRRDGIRRTDPTAGSGGHALPSPTHEGLFIRSAGTGDIQEIIAVLARSGLSSRQPSALEFHLTARGSHLFVGVVAGQTVAVSFCVSFGRTGWVGNVAVDPDLRGRGIGTALSKTAVERLAHAGVETVFLAATDLGRPIYERLGFVLDGVVYGIWERGATPQSGRAGTGCRGGDVAEALRLDGEATGEGRHAYLLPFADEVRVPREGRGVGYRVGLPWGGGPVVARDPSAAWELVNDMVEGDPDSSLAFPESNVAGAAIAQALGFSPARTTVRMRLGPGVDGFRPEMIYNVFSLAVG